MDVARGGKREGAGRPAGDGSTVIRLPVPVARFARRLQAGTVRMGDVAAFLDVEARTALSVPLMGCRVPCGFPSPADDYLEGPLDFNELLVKNLPATFSVRAAGDSMTGEGIMPGSICIVNRAIEAASGRIVLAVLANEFTIKIYRMRGNRVFLEPANPAYREQEIHAEMDFYVWGVVTGIVTVR